MPPSAGILLTPDDHALLRQMMAWWQQQPESTMGETDRSRPSQAPETYIALVGGSDIAERVGTTPGSASCAIYKINTGGTLESAGFSKTVYNLSTAAVPANSYTPVYRDKFGKWITQGRDEPDDVGTGECTDKIGGQDVDDLGVVSADDAEYFLVVTSSGCIRKAAIEDC